MRPSQRPVALAVFLGLSIAACPQATPPPVDPGPPTYWRDAKAVLASRCEGCHKPDGIGAFDLTTYETAKARASAIVASVRLGSMPPWLPSSDSRKFRHERRLDDAEIDTLTRWLDAGAPEGDPATRPATTDADIDTITPNLELAMAADYTPDVAQGDDDYRCFVLDPELAMDVAVTGFDIRPGNPRIVHHVILFSVAPDQIAALDAAEARDSAPGYTCFGDAGVPALMVGAWVPGTTVTKFPQGTGVVLGRGSKIVMQMHYNMLVERGVADLTKAELEIVEAPSVSGAYIFPILQNRFSVAPEEVKTVTAKVNTQMIYRFLPAGVPVRIHGVAPHMHLHGRSIRVTMTPAGGATEKLIEIPDWQFHWQQLYFFDEPLTLPADATIELECVFDNRSQAQPFVAGQQLPPRELQWGEGTLDEMCLNFFYASL